VGNDRLGHERGNLYPYVKYRPCKTEIAAVAEDFFQPRSSKMAGEEEDAVNHAVRAYADPRRF